VSFFLFSFFFGFAFFSWRGFLLLSLSSKTLGFKLSVAGFVYCLSGSGVLLLPVGVSGFWLLCLFTLRALGGY